jgi:hypothetical protein
VDVILPDNQPPIYMLLNHFKSKGYDDGTADAKRTPQAEQVKAILNRYNLTQDRVVVCGDFNDTPGSAPLLVTPRDRQPL